MAIFTSAEIDEQIASWKAALLAVAAGQEYMIQGRRLTRVDATDIRDMLAWLNAEKSAIEAEADGKTGGLQSVAFRAVR